MPPFGDDEERVQRARADHQHYGGYPGRREPSKQVYREFCVPGRVQDDKERSKSADSKSASEQVNSIGDLVCHTVRASAHGGMAGQCEALQNNERQEQHEEVRALRGTEYSEKQREYEQASPLPHMPELGLQEHRFESRSV